MDKKTFLLLAEGYAKQVLYENEFNDAMYEVAKKHSAERDFLGTPCNCSILKNAVLDVISGFDAYGTYGYWLYDCEGNFDKFNNGIVWVGEDGEKYRPNVSSLDELYQYILHEHTPNAIMEDCEFTKRK